MVTSTVENWERTNGIDYSGVFYTNKYAIEQLLKQGTGGVVVNVASMFGLVAVSDNIAYSASKGGVVNMTRAAGTMYAKEGIRVNAVAPGVIRTPLIDEPTLEQYAKLHPAGRVGEAQEVADLIAFLASDKAKFITGATIPIDGGYTAVLPKLAASEHGPDWRGRQLIQGAALSGWVCQRILSAAQKYKSYEYTKEFSCCYPQRSGTSSTSWRSNSASKTLNWPKRCA